MLYLWYMSITIKKASELTGFSEHTLRYYEKIGLIKDVKRNAGRRREYTEGNINWLLFLKKLKTTGMPIKSMKQYARMRYQGENKLYNRLIPCRKI